ncbi:MAG: hypothetical protein LBI96_07085 [Odoribacteraceae bacterium]|jgi:hypothetical protein|nr:hypothetical protein [Odoribacteraceae bacterium]
MKTFIIPALVAACLTACFRDKGNYTYKEVSTVTITNLQESYTRVSMQDTLRIDPGLVSTNPEDTFACLWLRLPAGNLHISESDTLGTDVILDHPVTLRQGAYWLALRVTNLANGMELYQEFQLFVTTRFSVGFYLLKDAGGYSELDLHLPDGDVMPDLLERSLGERVNGAPLTLGVTLGYTYFNPEAMRSERSHVINICTETGEMQILRVEDMAPIYGHDDLFIGNVPDDVPYYLTTSGNGLMYISSEGVSFASVSSSTGTGRIGFPSTITGGYAVNPRSLLVGQTLYFFDDLNGRFITANVNGVLNAYTETNQGGATMPYSPNNITRELLYFGHNFTAQIEHEGYAIFRDATGKRYLYRLLLNNAQFYNPVRDVVEIPSSTRFSQATAFATNELDGRLIYFLHDNKLYLYDVEQKTEELLAPAGIDASAEITYFANRYYINPEDAPANFNYLAIATRDAAGRYKVHLYQTLGGKPLGAPVRVLEGNGVVRKMQYMSNQLSSSYLVNNKINHIPLSM